MQRLDQAVIPEIRRQNDDLRFGILRFDGNRQFQAIHARHVNVSNDDVGFPFSPSPQCLLSILRNADVRYELAAQALEQEKLREVVIDE